MNNDILFDCVQETWLAHENLLTTNYVKYKITNRSFN